MSSHNQNIEMNDAILMAYINGELNIDEKKLVNKWLDGSEENRNHFENLSKTWEVSGKLKLKPVSVNTDDAWLRVKKEIESAKVIPIGKKKNNTVKIALSIAASLAIILIAYTFWDKPVNQIELMASNTVIEKTLADGSEITINKNSQIVYPEKFDKNERRIKLKGEAFFDIERDTANPFIIDLPDNFYVKVLGTSFTVNTNDDNNSKTVFVKSGKVEFGNSDNKLILVANEKAIFHADSKTFEKIEKRTDKAEELYWINEQLVFEGEKLTDIIDVLNAIFPEEISLNCDPAADYPIVSNHQQEDLEAILEVICLVHDLTLTKVKKAGKVKFTISCND